MWDGVRNSPTSMERIIESMRKGNFFYERLVSRFARLFRPLLHPAGKVDDGAAAMQEITQLRKTLEPLLSENESRYRALFDNMHDGVAIYRAEKDGGDFIFVDFNRAAERIESIKRDDILGKSILKIFPGVRNFGLFDVLRRVWKTGTPEHHPVAIYKDKRISGWRDNYVCRLPSGEIVAIYRDETARRKAEEALRESEEKYRLLVEHAPTGIAEFDLKTGKFVSVNDVMNEYTGYTKEEFLQMNPLDLLTRDSSKKWLERRNKVSRDEPISENVEYEVVTKDGRKLWVIMNVRFAYEGGLPVTVEVVLHNITERKRMEHQLRQMQKMEAIGTLAGGIAHDFNNILSAVIGYTELALNEVDEKSPTQEHMEEVLVAGKRAKDLVRQILTFGRRTEQEMNPLQVKLIAKEALKLVRASSPATIEIRQDIRSDSLVMGDPTQIHQIFMNLCTNAVYAMQEEGGVMEVSLIDAELDAASLSGHPEIKPGPFVKLTVSDTGHGIPPEVLDRVFDPFFTTKQKGEGTGLGLSVVHGIVRSHGGIVAVSGEEGKGATFDVFLPVVESTADPEIGIDESLPGGTERILFVDDEPSLANLGKRMLESLGYNVMAKTSSTDALETFKAGADRFDLVITDMTMPHMTGDRLARELMAVRPDIPVILCTGFSARMDEKKAEAMGIRAFVPKPILKKDIARTIRRVLIKE